MDPDPKGEKIKLIPTTFQQNVYKILEYSQYLEKIWNTALDPGVFWYRYMLKWKIFLLGDVILQGFMFHKDPPAQRLSWHPLPGWLKGTHHCVEGSRLHYLNIILILTFVVLLIRVGHFSRMQKTCMVVAKYYWVDKKSNPTNLDPTMKKTKQLRNIFNCK